jgi:hypothetical protein
MLYSTQIQHPNKSSTSYIGTTASINYHNTYLVLDMTSCMEDVLSLLINIIDMTKRSMSSPKCRSVEIINNPARLGSNHREVNYINYKQQQQQ